MHISPKGLNHMPIESNYKETSFKNVNKAYFNHHRYIKKINKKKYNVTINQVTT